MSSEVKVVGVRVGRRRDAGWVSDAAPALSWMTETDRPGWRQAGAELENDGVIHRLDGDASVFVEWPFAPLRPRQTARVRVRVTGEDGSVSDWSESCSVSAGHLDVDEWQGRLIGAAAPADEAQPVLLRRDFTVESELVRAVFYGTARGVYVADLNGSTIDDGQLNPGWTSYRHRLQYDVVDVTHLVESGSNSLVVDLAGGWYTESYGFSGRARRVYGDQPSFAGQLVLEYASGAVQVITSDSEWAATTEGPRVSSGIYAGEHFDARRLLPERNDAAWSAVREEPCDPVPRPRSSEPVRKTAELDVVARLTSPSGKTILDFGQNLVGRLRIRVSGEAGQVITLRHAEVLEDGELGMRPLRHAAATDSYTLRGDGDEEWEPRFTFHGFRYAQLDSSPGDLDVTDVTAAVLHSDMERTGWFESSHPLLNRLHENVVWGMRGNFLSIPTDCPQRDERLGWTGDIQVFAPTASYLYDCDAFLTSWLEDLASDQAAAGGIVPFVIPDVLPEEGIAAAAWGDAATVVPSVLHERFGDLEVVRRQYPSMRAWVDTITRLTGPELLWEGGFQFGDWLDPDAPPDDPARAKTDPDLVATAYFYRSTMLVAEAARLLGRSADVDEYESRAERIRGSFVAAYVTPAGRILSDSTTAYALALQFGLAPDEHRAVMGERLAHLVRAGGYRMSTGFVGTPLIQDALLACDHVEAAGRLLQQTQNPSWLYAVTMGATTIWERWDSMLEDGTINPGSMTSFNHYAFGAIADWMHRCLGGIAPAAPGYRRMTIAPCPVDGVDQVATSHRTPYGLAAVRWSTTNGEFALDVTVPPNTSAEVRLPDGTRREVGSGSHHFEARMPARLGRAPRLLDLDSTLAELADDLEAFTAVTAAMAELDPDGEWLGRRTRWVPQRTLREALVAAPPVVIDRVRAELRR